MTVNMIETNNLTSIPRLMQLVLRCLTILQHRFANPFDSTHESVFKMLVADIHSSILLDFRQLRSLLQFCTLSQVQFLITKKSPRLFYPSIWGPRLMLLCKSTCWNSYHPQYSHVQHKTFWNHIFCSLLPLQGTVDVLSKRQLQVCNDNLCLLKGSVPHKNHL